MGSASGWCTCSMPFMNDTKETTHVRDCVLVWRPCLYQAGWERFLCGGRGANDGSIAGRSQHAEGEGDACGGLRCAAAHPAAITCALVVQDAGRGGHGAGAHTSFDGPLFRAVLGVACDGIPPQYVLVGADPPPPPLLTSVRCLSPMHTACKLFAAHPDRCRRTKINPQFNPRNGDSCNL